MRSAKDLLEAIDNSQGSGCEEVEEFMAEVAAAQRGSDSEQIYATVVLEKGLSASQLMRAVMDTPLVFERAKP